MKYCFDCFSGTIKDNEKKKQLKTIHSIFEKIKPMIKINKIISNGIDYESIGLNNLKPVIDLIIEQ